MNSRAQITLSYNKCKKCGKKIELCEKHAKKIQHIHNHYSNSLDLFTMASGNSFSLMMGNSELIQIYQSGNELTFKNKNNSLIFSPDVSTNCSCNVNIKDSTAIFTLGKNSLTITNNENKLTFVSGDNSFTFEPTTDTTNYNNEINVNETSAVITLGENSLTITNNENKLTFMSGNNSFTFEPTIETQPQESEPEQLYIDILKPLNMDKNKIFKLNHSNSINIASVGMSYRSIVYDNEYFELKSEPNNLYLNYNCINKNTKNLLLIDKENSDSLQFLRFGLYHDEYSKRIDRKITNMFLKDEIFGSCSLSFDSFSFTIQGNSIEFGFPTFYNSNMITVLDPNLLTIKDDMYLTYNDYLVTNDRYFNSLSISGSELILYEGTTNENSLKISKDKFKCLTIGTPNRDKLFNNKINEKINKCLKYDFETYIKKRSHIKNTIYKQLIPNECYDSNYIECPKDGIIEEICQTLKIKPEFIYKQTYNGKLTLDQLISLINTKQYNKHHINLCCQRYEDYDYKKKNGLKLILNGEDYFDKIDTYDVNYDQIKYILNNTNEDTDVYKIKSDIIPGYNIYTTNLKITKRSMSSFKTVLDGYRDQSLKTKIQNDHQYDLYSIELLCLDSNQKPHATYVIHYKLTPESQCDSNIKHDFRFNNPMIITSYCAAESIILNNNIIDYNKNVSEIINGLQNNKFLISSKIYNEFMWAKPGNVCSNVYFLTTNTSGDFWFDKTFSGSWPTYSEYDSKNIYAGFAIEYRNLNNTLKFEDYTSSNYKFINLQTIEGGNIISPKRYDLSEEGIYKQLFHIEKL